MPTFPLFYRKPPLKKRHTKPCRFYQTSQCPLSTEECDFAHVLSNEPPLRSPTPCRYFAAGQCASGSRCRYRHIIDTPSVEDTSANIRVRVDSESLGGGICNDGGGISIMRGGGHGGGVIAQDPSQSTSPFSGIYPWHISGPFATSFPAAPIYSSSMPLAAPVPRPTAYSYHPHPLRCDITSSSSTCSSLSSDEGGQSFITEDPQYTEHAHLYQSQIRIAEEVPPLLPVSPFFGQPAQGHYSYPQYQHEPHSPRPSAHVPQLSVDTSVPAAPTLTPYPLPPPNAYGAYTLRMHASPILSPNLLAKGRSKSRSASRHKVANYKTKPCKFYKVSKTCPKGEECTFIHEDPKELAPNNVADAAPGLRPLPPGLPAKPVSLAEVNKKKNYFPISWRVIGGGVLIGGPKSVSSLEQEEDPDQGEATTNKGIDISEVVLPSKPMRRTRSSSNPPTPTYHVKIQRLFSAESPGNL